MTQLGRWFSLSEEPGSGVCCSDSGLFVGDIPLLERAGSNGPNQWRPRALPDLNRDLSKRYGLPVKLHAKLDGLAAVARALDRGDLLGAQIMTLHLRLRDPPALAKSSQSTNQIVDLARQLKASGMLKADWTHRSIRAGRPEARTASAANSRPKAAPQTVLRLTN